MMSAERRPHMSDDWYTHSINTAQCFEHRGFFTITLDEEFPVFVPKCRGVSRVGNLIRVPQGVVAKTLRPFFRISVAGGESFNLPEDAVLEIRDADGAVLCAHGGA